MVGDKNPISFLFFQLKRKENARLQRSTQEQKSNCFIRSKNSTYLFLCCTPVHCSAICLFQRMEEIWALLTNHTTFVSIQCTTTHLKKWKLIKIVLPFDIKKTKEVVHIKISWLFYGFFSKTRHDIYWVERIVQTPSLNFCCEISRAKYVLTERWYKEKISPLLFWYRGGGGSSSGIIVEFLVGFPDKKIFGVKKGLKNAFALAARVWESSVKEFLAPR